MLIFDLSNFAQFKAYFTLLATQNKSVDGFLFGDVEVGQNEARDWTGKKLWAWPPNRGRMLDARSDNYLLNRDGSIWIGGHSGSDKFEDEDAFYNSCEVIMKQVVAKMIVDRMEAKLSTDFNGHTIQRADLQISATKFIGCEYVFTWHDPTGFEYNEDDWEI